MRPTRFLIGGGIIITALTLAPTSAAQEPTPQAPAALEQRMTLSLHDLVLSALERNLPLLTSRTQNRIVETDVQSARSVFDPSVDATPKLTFGRSDVFHADGVASESATEGEMAAVFSGTLPFSTTYSASLSSDWLPELGHSVFSNNLTLQLSQPLLRGRGSSIAQAQIESALLAADSSDQRLLRTIEETIARVETAYWTLGLGESIEVNARDSLMRAQELLRRNEQLAELELLAEADLITARAGVQARQTTLVDAIRNREDAADALLFLVYGREASSELRALSLSFRTEPPAEEVPELPAMPDLESQPIARRNDVRAARYDVDESRVSLRLADNELLPDLDFVGGYTAWTQNVDGFTFWGVSRTGELQFGGWEAGAVFTFPIRNNAAKAAFAEATLAIERDQLNLSTVENTVRSEVRSAARGVTYAKEKLGQARFSTQLESQRYANGQEQLRLGLIDSFRLLQYELDVTAAELIESRALYSLANTIALYQLAVGEIDDKYVPGGATTTR